MLMKPLSLLPLSLSLALPLAAQTTDFSLASDAGVLAAAGGKDAFNSAPKGTMIGPSPYTWRLRSALSTGSSPSLSASSSMWAVRNGDSNGVQMGMTGLTRGSAASEYGHFMPSTSKAGAKGPIRFLMRMKHSPGKQGVIRVTWQSLLKFGATAAVSIDVGNDGSTEYKGGDAQGRTITADIPVTFPASGQIDSLISMDGTTAGAGQAWDACSLYGRFTAKFVDASVGTCTLTPYGQGCQGASVAGGVLSLGNDHVVSLKMTGGFPNAFVVETLGARQINLPLLAGCSLLCSAEAVLIHPTDAQGVYATTHKIPRTRRLTAYHQFLPIDVVNGNLVIRASNALKVVCK